MLGFDLDSLCPTLKSILTKFYQDQRVLQFLMNLNDSYHMMRGSILKKSHLSILGHVYSLLLQEEAQARYINQSVISW